MAGTAVNNKTFADPATVYNPGVEKRGDAGQADWWTPVNDPGAEDCAIFNEQSLNLQRPVEDFEVGWSGNESNKTAFNDPNASLAMALSAIFDSGEYTNDENYATAVAVSGDLAAVGCPGRASGGNVYGAVFILQRDTATRQWAALEMIEASDKADGDEFGRSLAMEDDWLLVGAPGDDSDKGAIYAFKFESGGFVQKQKFAGSTTAAGDRFGESAAISGAKCIVGAPQDDDQGSNDGSAWLFDRSGDTWSEDEKLLPSVYETNGYFGTMVALDAQSGIAVVSGRGYNNTKTNDEGHVFIFEDTAGTYTETADFIPDDNHRNQTNKFGESLAIDDGIIAIGAGGESIVYTLGTYKLVGAVYIVTKDPTWAVKQRLEMPEEFYRGACMEFGGGYECHQALAMSGNLLLVGCRGLTHYENPRSTSSYPNRDFDMGGAFLYSVSSTGICTFETRVYPGIIGRSGGAVALDADAQVALLGAYLEDRGGGTKTGAARVYSIAGSATAEVDQIAAEFEGEASAEDFEAYWRLPASGAYNPYNHMSRTEMTKSQQVWAEFDSGANKVEDFEAPDWNSDDATAYTDAPTPGTATGTAALFDSGTDAFEDFEDNWSQSVAGSGSDLMATFSGVTREDFETGAWTDTLDW